VDRRASAGWRPWLIGRGGSGRSAKLPDSYRRTHPPVRVRQDGEKVIITVGDEGEQVDAEAFARSVKQVTRVLEAIDRDMHGKRTVDWVISDLRMDDGPPQVEPDGAA
jgi:hypothetical protein